MLLFHLKFLEVQTNEISHRKYIYMHVIFLYVRTSTHVSFQLPIPILSIYIRNLSLVF